MVKVMGHAAMQDTLTALYADADTMTLLGRAAARAARVAVDSLVARDFVADAIGDLYTGAKKRDPSYATITAQLLEDVQARGVRWRKKLAQHAPIEELSEDDTPCVNGNICT